MGGKSKKQTVGYKYYLGQHLIMCHGPIDAITRATVDDRLAWSGYETGGQITVNAPELFGGEGREGGVSGVIDIEMGAPTQGQNSYLLAKLGALIPAYRGVVGAVFRQCYLGNNPYLKAWRFRGQRIHVRQNGIEQWYRSRAPIGSLEGVNAIYIALDKSASMGTLMSNGQTRLANAKVAVNGVLDYISQFLGTSVTVDIQIVAWGATRTSILRRAVDAGDISALKAFVNAITTVSGTDFRQGVADVAGFFGGAPAGAKRTVIFATDGEPNIGGSPDAATIAAQASATLFSTSGLSSFGFNIDLEDTTYTAQMDNTPSDGVPVVDGSDSSSLLLSVLGILGGSVDLNPIHIIRECLTDPEWGMGYTDNDIDAASFEAAADQLVIEALGMSLLWDKQIRLEVFVDEVKKHIDAALYVSRSTGKFVVKLIRNDYDPDDLILLDESNIARVEDPSRASFGELVNSVTVKYWDAATGKDASLTVTDTAMVQVQGAVINTTLQYPGFTNARTATIAAQRDLKALSAPALSCTIFADSTAKDLKVGDVFKFSWSRWGLSETIMRVTGIAYGTGRSNQVRINCTQDEYDTNTNIVVSVPGNEWTDPSLPPSAATYQFAAEAPYYEIVQVLGQADADNKLLTHPEIGYVLGAVSRAPSAINARMWVDSGTGYEDTGTVDFSPYGELLTNITKTQTAFTLTAMEDQDEIVIGTHFQVDDEIMRIDSINTGTGAVTVGRGVLDTVPAEHLAGAIAFFWDQYAGFDPTEYVDGESVDVKIAAVSGAGVQPLSEVAAMPVAIDQRAARPYAPGDLRLNGESYAVNPLYTGAVTVTWAHRDRTQQTSGTLIDHTAGNIGPEAGTVYRLRGYIDDVLDYEEDDIAGTTASWSPSTQSENCRVEIHAKRDGLYSWQAPSHTFSNATSGAIFTEEGDSRLTEEGDTRYSE